MRRYSKTREQPLPFIIVSDPVLIQVPGESNGLEIRHFTLEPTAISSFSLRKNTPLGYWEREHLLRTADVTIVERASWA